MSGNVLFSLHYFCYVVADITAIVREPLLEKDQNVGNSTYFFKISNGTQTITLYKFNRLIFVALYGEK